jgi:hypothetical protein
VVEFLEWLDDKRIKEMDMTTQQNSTPKKADKKPIPKPGRKKSYEEAVTSVMRRYAGTLAKLAK